MTRVLVDTSVIIALFVQSETHHHAIDSYLLANPTLEWVILSTVFEETVTWLRAKVSISASIELGRVLRKEHSYLMLSESDDQAVWNTFCRYDDKSWSYTDCSLLAMATRLNITTILSFDKHIKQMSGLGIVCLP